ncbi:MAG: hypothetical protein V4547_04780 [Bacteroidota bacterium]
MTKIFFQLTILCISLSAFAQNTVFPLPAFEFLSKYSNVRDFTISQNQNEAYFSIQSPHEEISVIAYTKKNNGNWSEPELVNFTGKYRDIEPFLTSDGLKLYFSSNRPIIDSLSKAKDYDIWYVERTNLKSHWSEPINLGEIVNTSNNEFYPSLAINRNLYFTSDAQNSSSKDDIYFSKWDGTNYTISAPLDSNINSAGYEFNAYISPNENFIIYTIYGRKDGLGSGDLYISFKDKTGKWEKGKNLGKEVNSEFMDYCPYFDITTNTLYFTSKRSSIGIQNFTTMKEFEKTINKYENGLSRIYKISIKM